MERTLEAYRSGDRTMLLWNILQSHQTRSYEQALEVLEALLEDPEHAELAARYSRSWSRELSSTAYGPPLTTRETLVSSV
jgi:hypothetical protein